MFKPAGVSARDLSTVTISLDEFEALRLADLEGLYQADAAVSMGISRPTFGRIIESAHRKVAGALVRGQALVIGGGPVSTEPTHGESGGTCGHAWRGPEACPRCAGDATVGMLAPMPTATDSGPCPGRRRRCGRK